MQPKTSHCRKQAIFFDFAIVSNPHFDAEKFPIASSLLTIQFFVLLRPSLLCFLLFFAFHIRSIIALRPRQLPVSLPRRTSSGNQPQLNGAFNDPFTSSDRKSIHLHNKRASERQQFVKCYCVVDIGFPFGTS